ncbi:phosphoribosylaminoimidazolesuccinocarboxamide synthase [Sporosarcina gallistercoris]|uniref:Phosphoribosylaminoimidazole-succinocarboxamide synthase n=1 Tax=Sporosarcina gallistercoris TaxID=2762245 RepID=A0ABR8PJE2_9BACL|nr:phosphoribosylaminoimidazolesuccinocarboxamide synthase [Sporosarcina gallistercoris]MBD7908283.1 phosphoribosylaminoimidazolesuccinocarboxamide synthase [Sporosarcina gallistercoris]
MEKRELLYEGKAKKIFATTDEGVAWVEYKDAATAFNGEKKEEIIGKGALTNGITSLLFSKLHEAGIPTHFIKQISSTEQLVKKVSIIPLEVVTRNVVAGSLSKRLGLDEGQLLKHKLVEFYYKDDALGDPLLTEAHIQELELATKEEVHLLQQKALEVNTVLTNLFAELGVRLIDFKLEFGKLADGEILLADEISPDTCRLWDSETEEKLDKDVFRRNLGSLVDVYETIYTKLGGRQYV